MHIEVKPTDKLFTYYHLTALIILVFFYIPALFTLIYGYLQGIWDAVVFGAIFLGFTLLTHIIVLIWAKLYVKSMVFILDDEKLISRKGVILKSEDIAHYDKVQLVSIKQGMLERMLGIASLEIKTAAIGLPGGDVKIRGLDLAKANELRDIILEKIGMLTEERKKDFLLKIYEELVRIRELLEAIRNGK